MISGSTVNISNHTNIWEIYCSANSMEFTESSELTSAGTHFNTVISGFIPQDNTTLQEAIEYMEPRKNVEKVL